MLFVIMMKNQNQIHQKVLKIQQNLLKKLLQKNSQQGLTILAPISKSENTDTQLLKKELLLQGFMQIVTPKGNSANIEDSSDKLLTKSKLIIDTVKICKTNCKYIS